MVERYLQLAGLPAPSAPIAAEPALARQQAQLAQRERERIAQQQALERLIAQRKSVARQAVATRPEAPAPWGSPAARRQEIARVRREIEERKRRAGQDPGAENP